MKNLVKEQIDYLKDNPEGYWFKRKLYGWGWTPATWQGWAITLGFIVGVLGYVFYLEEKSVGEEVVVGDLAPLLLAVIALIVICYKTGEPPKWQWGEK